MAVPIALQIRRVNTFCPLSWRLALTFIPGHASLQLSGTFMLNLCCVQSRGDDRKGARDTIDKILPTRVNIADRHPPTRVFAGIGGFPPEAQNENLIEQRSLCVHEPRFAWRELGTIVRWFRSCRLPVTSARRDDTRRMRPGSRQDHGAAGNAGGLVRRYGLSGFAGFGGSLMTCG